VATYWYTDGASWSGVYVVPDVLTLSSANEVAIQESVNTRRGVERCLRFAFEFTRKRNKAKKLTLSGKTMGSMLTENEKAQLKSLGKITPEEIRQAEVEDVMPRFRLACQYVVRDQDILVKFSGEPGGA